MKKFSLFIVGFLAIPSCVLAADISGCQTSDSVPDGKLSLDEIVSMGLCRNPQTRAAYSAVLAARANKNAAYAPYMPSVNVGAEMGWSKDSASIDAVPGHTHNHGEFSSATLTANYLLFDFGKRYSDLNNMTAVWKAVDFDHNTTVQTYVFDVVQGYYTLLMAQADEVAAADLLKVAKEAKQMSDQKYKAGVVPKADVLKAETTVAQRQMDMQRAEMATEVAAGQLLYLLSYEQNQKIVLDDSETSKTREVEGRSVDELIAIAKEKRPDLLSVEQTTKSAKAQWDSVFLDRLPSLSGYGSVGYVDTERAIPGDRHSSAIGLRVSMPLFSGFADLNKQRAAKYNYDKSIEQLKNKQDAIELDVWKAYQNYITARELLSSSETLLISATESERVTRGMYKVGRSTMLDWMTQQAELASAKRQAISAKYDFLIKRSALALAIGDVQADLN